MIRTVITHEMVKTVAKELEKQFNVVITSNKKSGEVQAIASILDILGVKNKEEFMKEVSITIYKHIYLSFEPGDLAIEPLLQLEIIAHELKHTMQWEKDPAKFAIGYLTQHEKRTELEVEALACNMELHYRVTGHLYDAKAMSSHLKWYRVTSKDINVAEKQLAILGNILKQGGNYSIPVDAIMKLL